MKRITHQDVYTYLSSERNMKRFIERCDFYLLLDFHDKVSLHIKEFERQEDSDRHRQFRYSPR